MSNQGWISLHRSFMDSPLYQDSQAVHLWVHLLLKANHKDGKVLIGNKMISVPRGSFITGRDKLVLETGLNRSKIERTLKLLISEQQIEQRATTKYR